MIKDKFISRLMIPITNDKGKVVGFTGRVFPFDQNPNRPKYLNSSESDIFKKSDILFGLDKSIKEIRQERWVIIVEGNMDVISAHKHGITNIIASQGTSFTDNQVRLLKRSRATKILIAFDNDNAGLISGRKLFIKLINNGFDVFKFIIPSEFKDLDEYLPNLSKKIILKDATGDDFETIDYMQFELNLIAPYLQSEQSDIVRQHLYEYISILAQCPSIIQDQYINRLESISNLSKHTLLQILEETKKNVQNDRIKIDFELEDDQLVSDHVDTKNHNGVTELQNLIALSYKLKLDSKINSKLYFGYKLIQFLYPESFQDKDLDEFKENNSDMLELIYSNLKHISTTEIIITFNKIKEFLRQNEAKIFTDKDLKKHYLQFFTN